jgi:DedD protein
MTANRPYDEDDLGRRDYVERRADPNRADREISLGTPTILGIFFALALVCAGFFGFGYTMGRKSTQAAPIVVDPAADVTTGAPKPTAGSLAARPAQPTPPPMATTPIPAPADTTPPQTTTVALTPPSTPKNTATPADAMIVGDKRPPATTPQPATAPQPPTSYTVQVAAVSTQEVADILTSSLQKKGYAVAIHHEPQDKLLHIQIGPFTDRKEAEATRQRVLADGFNAIVK